VEIIARNIVRTADAFDGTTPETVTGYSTPPGQNILRTYKSAEDSVGAFTTQDLGAPDKERPIALWYRLIGTPNAVTSRVEIRSAFVGDTNAAYGPTNILLESHSLLTTWVGPLVVGPTDRVCPVHEQVTPSTMEFRSMDLLRALELNLFLAPGAPPAADDCCVTSPITVVADTTLDPWNNTLIVFIAPAAAGTVITLPVLLDTGLGRKAVLVYEGIGLVVVKPQAGEQMNGDADGLIEINGKRAVIVERRETTWTATQPVLSNGEDIENAVAGATEDISIADGSKVPVRFEFNAPGFLRMPLLASSGIDQEFQLVRAGGAEQAILIPQAGEPLNGKADGRLFLGWNENATVRRTLTGGWLAVGDGAQRPCRTLTLAADATLALWGAGRINVLCTKAAAQTVTMPLNTDPIADGAEANFGCAGAGGLTINGNGALIRSGTGAPAATMVLAQHENARLVWAGTLWIAFLGT